MKLRDPINRDGLLDLLGRLFYAARSVAAHSSPQRAIANAAASVGDEVSPEEEETAAAVAAAGDSERSHRGISIRDILAAAGRLIRDAARLDAKAALGQSAAVKAVVEAMSAAGYYVESSIVGASAASASGNAGDAWVAVQTVAEDGLVGPHWVPQTIDVRFHAGMISASSPARRQGYDPDWPGGSGDRASYLPAYDLSAGLLANGRLDAGTVSLFDGWTTVGTIDSAIEPPQDEIQFSAVPTGGYFRLTFVNRLGVRRVSGDIPAAAGSDDVRRALADLDGELSTAIVSPRTAGPGFVVDHPDGRHDLPALGIESYLTGASGSVVRVRAGVPGGYAGRAAKWTGDGTSLAGLFQAWRPARAGSGLGIVRILHDGALTGTLQIGLFSEPTTSAAALPGPNGHSNMQTIPLASLAADQYHIRTVPLAWVGDSPGYFGLRLSAPLTAGKYLALARPQMIRWEAAADRPAAALIRERFGPADGDRYTITVTNDLGGEFLTWWVRAFGPAALPPRLGTTLIPDTILAE